MAPCQIVNDTVDVGTLTQGDYTIVYQLIDEAHLMNSDSITESGTLEFTVLE